MISDLLNMPFAVILLLLIFILTAIRKIGKYELPIWLLFTIGASLVIVCGKISLADALHAIDLNIILYLFGVFIIGAALEKSNYLEFITLNFLKNISSASALLARVIVIFSISTLFLMNDTVAIIGVPTILLLCKKTKLPPLPLFLTLAYTLTISSVSSPIANPQNLLIANEITAPFINFFYYLLVPTIINCIILFFFMRLCFNKIFKQKISIESATIDVDWQLARLAKISVIIMMALISTQIMLSIINSGIKLPFSIIALLSASPIIFFHKKKVDLFRLLDWHTLIFFLSLFIFIEAVWLSNYFQNLIHDLQLPLESALTITVTSLIVSQLISNVPLVVLYLPFLTGLNNQSYMLLAMASTMAGNLFILGAASNIIIIQNAKKRGGYAFSFLQFCAYGIPLTIINVLIFYGWLSIFN